MPKRSNQNNQMQGFNQLNVLPHNIEAEQAIIGSAFLNPKCIPKLHKIVQSDDFYREAHQNISRAIFELNRYQEYPSLTNLKEKIIPFIKNILNEVHITIEESLWFDLQDNDQKGLQNSTRFQSEQVKVVPIFVL